MAGQVYTVCQGFTESLDKFALTNVHTGVNISQCRAVFLSRPGSFSPADKPPPLMAQVPMT
jgi:hypothetical protein